jgi:hypothetical protein
MDQKQFDTALTVLQNYLKSGDSIAAKFLEAHVYNSKKDLPKAISLHARLPGAALRLPWAIIFRSDGALN